MAEEFETVELEYSEDDVLYFLVDEDDREIGFVLEEGGQEVEYYYEGFNGDDYEPAEQPEPGQHDEAPGGSEPEEHGYLYKMAAIAGHEGNKARQKAEKQLDKARGKAEAQLEAAKKTAADQTEKVKAKADEMDLGITREGVAEATSDLNAIAKEGAATAKELKEAYDDIMDNFGFLMPKKVRRRLP